MKETLLIVDDEQNTLEGLKEIMTQEGYHVLTALSAEEGLKLLNNDGIDLVITDLMLPGMDGMEFARTVLRDYIGIQVIIITAFGTVKSAVESMKEGIYNYITKPVHIDELLVIAKKALDESRLRKDYIDLKSKVEAKYKFINIIGASGAMIKVFEKVLKVAKTNSTVILRGESGTGKELIARAIHEKSARADKPFMTIDCTSFPETLLESELFGYEKGAFTGAYKTKIGCFEAAEGGTIFLDEIGNISPDVQVRLLRVLQERIISRLGSTKPQKVDVRVIAATNTNLENAIKKGTFRKDLYYRLNVIPIILPQLKQRRSDISMLIDHFIKKYAAENDKNVKSCTPEVEKLFIYHDWPGNVRELENAIENAVVMCDESVIVVDDLPKYLVTKYEKSKFAGLQEDELDLSAQLELAEKRIIKSTLEKVDYNKTKAAELLSINLRTLHNKARKYNL
ncbi:hypothetical protein AMJ80_08660 [bacterium SM23_31]|nr:MAG: hypothetical protein AMJ80_08660 [bacterium SM23_31]